MIFAGCASNTSNRSGSLQDAMDAAAADDNDDRMVDTEFETDEYIDDIDSLNIFYAEDPKPKNKPLFGVPYYQIKYSRQNFFSENLDYSNKVSFSTGNNFNDYIKSFLSLEMGIGIVDIRKNSPVYDSIENTAHQFEIGLTYLTDIPQYYFPETFHPFYTLSIKRSSLFWTYRNPIFANEYDELGNVINVETIEKDYLFGYDGLISIGSIIQINEFFNLNGCIDFGYTYWDLKTHKGFNNDVFNNNMYINGSLSISLTLNN